MGILGWVNAPHSSSPSMGCFHLGGRAFHFHSLPRTQQGCAALQKISAGERHTKKKNYFRDHPTPYECLPLPHSPTTRPPIRRIARPPTPQLSSSSDSRATHARTLLPAALASVPFGFVLVRVSVRRRGQRPWHHIQVPVMHKERRRGQRPGHQKKYLRQKTPPHRSYIAASVTFPLCN